jgi:hypothetical protein
MLLPDDNRFNVNRSMRTSTVARLWQRRFANSFGTKGGEKRHDVPGMPNVEL